MKPIDNRQKQVQQMKAAKGHFLSFRDKSHLAEKDQGKKAAHGETKAGEHSVPFQASAAKIGRNDPCPCGSGKKYKKCCLK
jgi:uncharacterized protein YecA (UPF0149 family)